MFGFSQYLMRCGFRSASASILPTVRSEMHRAIPRCLTSAVRSATVHRASSRPLLAGDSKATLMSAHCCSAV